LSLGFYNRGTLEEWYKSGRNSTIRIINTELGNHALAGINMHLSS
jgi:hypothetical protein